MGCKMLVLCLSWVIALVDQASKAIVQATYGVGEGRNVIPGFFDLRYVRNPGAAWGMLAGFSNLLVVVSIVMLAVLLIFRRSIMTDSLIHRCATGLMVGGILGNLIDRLRYGYVVDFFDFYIGASHFPVFNVADAAICTGVGLYILSQWFPSHADAAGDGRA